jgi:hypothetical protein
MGEVGAKNKVAKEGFRAAYGRDKGIIKGVVLSREERA